MAKFFFSKLITSAFIGILLSSCNSKKDKVNNLNTNFKLTGFLNTKDNNYVLVNYLGQIGTITEESIGGLNTTLLPNGAKVLNIDPKKLKLIINFEDKDYILEL